MIDRSKRSKGIWNIINFLTNKKNNDERLTLSIWYRVYNWIRKSLLHVTCSTNVLVKIIRRNTKISRETRQVLIPNGRGEVKDHVGGRGGSRENTEEMLWRQIFIRKNISYFVPCCQRVRKTLGQMWTTCTVSPSLPHACSSFSSSSESRSSLVRPSKI